MENLNSMNISQASQAEMRRAVLESPNVVCECGSKTFVAGYVLKRLSSLYSGTGKEQLVEIPAWVCSQCGKVPKEVRENKNFAKIFGEEDKDENKTETTLKI